MIFSEKFVEKLRNAESIIFFTGAGISAESGISTFRGKDGIWNKLRPEELANFDAFLRNTDIVWEWYQFRRKVVNEAAPNAGHTAIKEFEKYYDIKIVTQNVDNLHGRAGSKTIYELHGNIERNYCIKCKMFFNIDEFEFTDKVPNCKKCGGFIRPDVVWFGEFLPQEVFANAEKAAAECDICFVVGTSAIVYPAAYIPHAAINAGAYLVEINVEQTEFSNYADISLVGPSGEILPKILDEVKKVKS